MRPAKTTPITATAIRGFWLFLTGVVLLFGLSFISRGSDKAEALAGVNEQINFQGRLLTNSGAVVPDGNYNIEFKIYQDGDGVLGGGDETLKWTETRTGGNKVLVKNGYFSIYMGSVTPFGGSIDWNQDTLWLSVNIGGTGVSPSWDGEMSPFNRFSSTPYALNANAVGGLQKTALVQLAQGIQTDSSTTNASIYLNKTGSTANILQFQRGGADVLVLDNNGALTVSPATNSTGAIRVQNSGQSETLLSVDTTPRSGSGGNLVKIGDSTGTDTSTTILQLDSATAAPTSNLSALNGGLYYNSTTNRVQVIENGVVKTLCNMVDGNCGSAGNSQIGSLVAQVYDSAGGTDVNTASPTAIPWGAHTRVDSGITHSTVTNNTRVYLDNAGWYRLSYNVSSSNQTANRNTAFCQVRFNGTTYNNPSGSYSYSRNTTDAGATNSSSVLVQANAGDYYEVMCSQSGSTGAGLTIAGQSWTQVEKIDGATPFVANTGLINQSSSTDRLQLKIGEVGDAGLEIQGIAAQTANFFEIRSQSSDTNPFFAIDSSQKLQFGAGGGSSFDVSLFRSGIGSLQTDGSLKIGDGSGNDSLSFTAEATNPTCSAGGYAIWANSVDLSLKKCQNGTISNLDTGVNTVGAFNGGTANSNGATITGSTIYLQSASTTNPGLVDTSTQSFAGSKTFVGTTTKIQPTSDVGATFQVQNATGTSNLLYADIANSAIGVGIATPTEKLTVNGNLLITAQPDSTPHTFASGCNCLTNATAGTFGADTARDAISNSVIFKGKLFVATSETNGAGVYRYDGGNTWTLVTNAVGKVQSADAVNIDGYALAVYDGKIFIGTQTGANLGALYYSTDADTGNSATTNWTQINNTKGSFGMSQNAVDGVSDLAIYNGALYVATQEPNLYELGRWNGLTGASAVFTQANPTDGKIAAETTADKDGVVLQIYQGMLIAGGITGSTTAAVAAYQGSGTTWTMLTTTTGANGTLGADTANIDITSMAVYNGSLYVATRKNNSVGIYRYNASVPISNVPANFVRVNQTVGRIDTADATNIDGAILRVFNGELYAGSITAAGEDTGALYRFDGFNTWTLINTTRGTFGAQTGVNAIANMIEYNDTLYVGTDDGTNGIAGIYTFQQTSAISYGLKFEAPSGNIGSIFFSGDTKANDNQGHTGSFVFTNSVQLNSAGFDYSEDYPTNDSSIEPGEIVAVDPLQKEFVKRATRQDTPLGIYSENPGFRISEKPENQLKAKYIPIALTGRVPLKVSTENGEIKPGDSLTLSSTPGVAMKATKSGKIIGTAMEGYSEPTIGKVLTFVLNSGFNGDNVIDLAGLLVDGDQGSATDSISSQNPDEISQGILTFLKNNQSGSADLSQIYTDRLSAGLEVITPKLTADTAILRQIKPPKGQDLAFSIGEDQKIFINDGLGNKLVTFDNKGNATFAGQITADKIKANQIEGLEIYTNQISSLSSRVNQVEVQQSSSNQPSPGQPQNQPANAALPVSLNQFEAGNLSIQTANISLDLAVSGGLKVGGPSEFKGDSLFYGIVTFVEKVVFKNDVSFEGRVKFNNDTGGFAAIKPGEYQVRVDFDKPYENNPVVNVNVGNGKFVQFAYKDLSTDGFTIVLKEPATEQVEFSWVALNINDPRLVNP